MIHVLKFNVFKVFKFSLANRKGGKSFKNKLSLAHFISKFLSANFRKIQIEKINYVNKIHNYWS